MINILHHKSNQPFDNSCDFDSLVHIPSQLPIKKTFNNYKLFLWLSTESVCSTITDFPCSQVPQTVNDNVCKKYETGFLINNSA